MNIQIQKFLREMTEQTPMLNEETVEDFFKFLGNDPQDKSFASLRYVSSLDRGLAKKKTNPMKGRIYKMTDYQFRWSDSYKAALKRNNPDWELQQRNGEYSEIEGFTVLDRDRAGDEGMPIVNETVLKSQIIILDETGGIVEVIGSRDLQEKYGEYFIPSFFTPYTSGSGQTFKALKVKRMINVKAGSKDWTNPHFEFAGLNLPTM